MDWLALLMIAPFCFCLTAWIILVRRTEKITRFSKTALIINSAISSWALFLYVQHLRHPEYAKLPPWQDPINLDAALLMLIVPIGIVVGFVAAAKHAPWWLVALIELASLPLLLVGCAAAVSV